MLSNESISSAEKPLVSVLIPAYNHERYVQETIRSIIAQTYKNIELLIIDDGSPDSTWEKINELKEECEQRFIRVIFQKQENGGSVAALNRLFELSQGKYVYLIASDDVAFPNAIQMQSEFLEEHSEYALVIGDNIFIDENSQEVVLDENLNRATESSRYRFKTFHQQKVFSTPHIKMDYDNYCSYNSIILTGYVVNGHLIRRSALEQIEGFTAEAPGEDWYLILQLSKYYRMKFLDTPLFYYRRHLSNSFIPSHTLWGNLCLVLHFYSWSGYSNQQIAIYKRYLKTFLYEKKAWRKKHPYIGIFIWWYYRFFYVPYQRIKYRLCLMIYR